MEQGNAGDSLKKSSPPPNIEERCFDPSVSHFLKVLMPRSAPPDWALDWTKRVAQAEGKSHLPEMTWQETKKKWTSGHCKGKRNAIHITAGTHKDDQRFVVVHELAHWAAGCEHHHNKVFYKKLWDLCALFEIPADYVVKREGLIYAGCVREALRRGLVDADTASEVLKKREEILEWKRRRAERRRQRAKKINLVQRAASPKKR